MKRNFFRAYFNNLSLNKKFIYGAIGIFFICSLASGYVLYLYNDLNNTINEQKRITFAIENAYQLDMEVLKIIIALNNYKETKDPKYKSEIIKHRETAILKKQQLRSTTQIEEIEEHLEAYDVILPQRIQLRDRLILAVEKNDTKIISENTQLLNLLDLQAREILEKIIAAEQNAFTQSINVTDALRRTIYYSTVVVTAISLFLVSSLFYLIIRSIKDPADALINMAQEISLGNLTYRAEVNSADEMGMLAKALNKMALHVKYAQNTVTDQKTKLQNKIQELEQTKLATLNILEDLSAEKAKDEALLSSIGDGVLATNEFGIIILANDTVKNLLGWKKEECIGKILVEKLIPVDSKGNRIEPFKLNTKVTNASVNYLRLDNSVLPASVTTSPIEQEGKIRGTIVVIRDSTKEREVDRMKTEFISLASHQLRTPLTALNWFSEMLLNGDAGKLNEEQYSYVKNIADSNKRMVELVDALLNISRIESGRIVIDPKPTKMLDLLNEVLSDVKTKIQTKKQNLIVSTNPHLPIISIDPNLIRQVLLNLLTNSIKYTPSEGEISVFISENGKDMIVQVSDNGFGIPKKEISKVFQKFYRGENIISVETDGTGLGLYLIKAIIEASGGKIWFESEEGKGTTFFFSLPLTGSETKHGEVTLHS